MMDFPTPTFVGQVYNPGTGPIYTWDGVAWSLTPVNIKTAQQNNLVVNPAMQVSQEIAKNSASSAPAYPADNWQVSFATSGTLYHACNQEPTNVPAGDVDWFLRMSTGAVDTSIAGSDVVRILSYIEGGNLAVLKWGTPQAKQAVIRFKARSSFLGTFGLNLREFGSSIGFSKNFTFTQANVWQEFSLAVPPCTSGTWKTDATGALLIQFITAHATQTAVEGVWQTAAPGVPASGLSNWMAVINQGFDLANVGLYPDPDNTGIAPPFEVPDYAAELLKCQRYFCRLGMTVMPVTGGGIAYNNTAFFPVTMRTNPTLSIYAGSPAGATVGTLAYNPETGFRQNSSATGAADIGVQANARL